jgi:hypothetical protein
VDPLALLGHVSGLALAVHDDELVANLRRSVAPEDRAGWDGPTDSMRLSRSLNMARTLPL